MRECAGWAHPIEWFVGTIIGMDGDAAISFY